MGDLDSALVQLDVQKTLESEVALREKLQLFFCMGYDEGTRDGYCCGVTDGWAKGYTAAEKQAGVEV